MRILITGSRNWWSHAKMNDALIAVIEEAYAYRGEPRWEDITVVTGGQKTRIRGGAARFIGADHIAAGSARSFGINVEEYPADWDRYGKRAGPIRNQEMVDLGADICLAFPIGESRGTRDCMERARKAGIPVCDLGSD